MEGLPAPLARWLADTHGAPTPAQHATIPRLLAGEHVLLSSPTGSGKTLAAFLAVLTDLVQRAPLQERTYCVYVSPLRALVNDMAKNLAAPIEGAGLDVRVAIRTGDTTAYERQKQARKPPHILVTTPESLALLLSSPVARENLRGVKWVVVDEIHAIAETKRGAQLSLTLERLAAFSGEFQRVGLSATVSPVETVAEFLGGDRPVHAIEVPPKAPPALDVDMPVPEPLALTTSQLDEALLDRIEREISSSKTLLVFTNTRASAERLAARLKKRHAPDEVETESVDPEFGEGEDDLVAPHHGSMSKASRLVVEERLKRAEVRCVVASSSLELGIHAEHVDRVILLGSPKSAARALQRIGRSGHRPGDTARATLLVSDPGELPEALAVRRLAMERVVEDVAIPENALDVLAQHLVALRLDADLSADAAFALTRRAFSHRSLAREDFDAVWEDLPRVPRFAYLQNAGTIPESGLLKVFHGETYVGEVEEDFAAGLQPQDAFLLAGKVWRYVRATPARVLVVPAKAGEGSVPAWRGEGISATFLLASETENEMARLSHGMGATGVMKSQAMRFLAGHARFAGDAEAETFPTEAGRALVVHARIGRHANDALARTLSLRVDDARGVATDGGFAILGPRGWKPTRASLARMLREPLEADLRAALSGSDLLKRRFRQVATRALVLRREAGETLGMRQQHANMLLARLERGHPEHFLLREAMGECFLDALDLPAAERWRADAAARGLRLASLPCASPLAARILAPPGDARHEALRDAHDAISYQFAKLSRR